MTTEPSSQERDEAMHSLKRFFASEMDGELTDLQARMLLEYFLKEIAPLAYNQGVKDAEAHFRRQLEDLAATCYQAPFTYWQARKKG